MLQNNYLLSALKDNVDSTIGTEVIYEIIAIDNSDNKYSIFEAYNIGIKRSKGDFLCFAHENIKFHTNNWGINLLNHFNHDNSLGMIGVAGGSMLPRVSAP